MELFRPPEKQILTRRSLLKTAGLSALGLGLYSSEVERHWVEVLERSIVLNQLSSAFDGLRLVQISDIHMDEYTEPLFLRHVVHKINALKPDVVLLTGDFVSTGPASHRFARKAAWQCAEILDELACKERIAVMGNHDVSVSIPEVTQALTAHGILVLNDAHTSLTRGSSRLWLSGMIDPADCVPLPERAIPVEIRHKDDEPVILLCHSPDYADQLLARPVGSAVSLMLSGHTHGGQIRLPFFGPIVTPYLGSKYIHGLFRLDQLQLNVNRGIGAVGVPFRFNCPPELTVLTLRTGRGAESGG